ncbi:hypothetical protein NDN08_002101 [Rhodosorus marinus]|uniref:Uncharacterized protein n=1 Tax=Rhodosorus marinus TaxID=101924 RepID=A0AAV8USS6_9RHOD|nr:hypothetical protein NDN08_002101 [Rhodosorus marinus]
MYLDYTELGGALEEPGSREAKGLSDRESRKARATMISALTDGALEVGTDGCELLIAPVNQGSASPLSVATSRAPSVRAEIIFALALRLILRVLGSGINQRLGARQLDYEVVSIEVSGIESMIYFCPENVWLALSAPV